MTDQLERWYRRLIAIYPPDHRAVYAEDMLNVLMDGALPGQQRPDRSTGIDLLKGAAAAWALRARAGSRVWQRAEAPAAVVLLSLLTLCTRSFVTVGLALDATPGSSYGRWGELGLWLPDEIWLPVTIAAVLGLRRTAAWAAWGVAVILPLVGSAVMAGGWTPGYLGGLQVDIWLIVSLIAAIGLSSERGLRPGFHALGRIGTLTSTVGALTIGLVTMPLPAAVGAISPWRDRFGLLLLGTGFALVVLACVRVAVRDGARAQATAAAMGILLLISGYYGWHDGGTWVSDLNEQLDITLPLTVLVCGLAVAWSTAHAARHLTVRPRDVEGPTGLSKSGGSLPGPAMGPSSE